MDTYGGIAGLYDIAFSWDVEDEVDWLLQRLGADCRRILEPGCGSGRMFPAFARKGIAVAGIDISAVMLDRARRRMSREGHPAPLLQCADMAAFDLGETFDGAICPINTFGYLHTPERVMEHYRTMARHLRAGARYLLQVDLADLANYSLPPIDETSSWESEAGAVRIRTTWAARGFDPDTRIETQVSRFEILSGPDEGKIVEEEHLMRLWDWESWRGLIAASPFTEVEAFAGTKGRPGVEVGPELEHARLPWHVLAREG